MAATPLSKAALQTRRAGESRPNLLLLMTDQQRGDCIGADGNPAIRTPNLDRIANEGARFTSAYTSTPSCTPARSALLTGKSPWNHGMLGYGRVAEEYPYEMPRVLSEAGYYTYSIGKNHFSHQRNNHGYDFCLLDESGREQSPDFRSDYRSWFWSQAPHLDPDETGIGWNDYRARPYALPENLHPTHWTGRSAVRFLENYERPEPFFLKVSFARPHSPYDPPKRLFDSYEDAPIPERSVGDWAEKFRERSSQEPTLWHGDLGADTVRHSRQGYYGAIEFIDEQIGRILETLEKRNMLDNTLILFISDHGDMMGDHHHWRKCYAYEGSARIPFLARWPAGLLSAERGQVIDKPVEIRDVLPTFLDGAGIEAPEDLDGRSVLDLVRGKPGWREFIDLEHTICYSPTNHWNALTDGKWKYIFQALDAGQQLFDLTRDPGELTDLAGDPAHAAELRRWRSRMVKHFEERGEPFLRGGDLAPRPERFLYSPNYPKTEG
jgi:arylsulfatase A-like enzyme